MNQLLEILGRGIAVPVADLIWQYLKAAVDADNVRSRKSRLCIDSVLELVAARKPQAAAKNLADYLSSNPDCPHGHLALAALYLGDNHVDLAVEHLNIVYRSRPSNMMALYALGHCCERNRKESQAIAFYQDCLKFHSYLRFPRQRLAAVYFKNAQLEKTIHEYRQLADEYPDDMTTLVTLGWLYVAAGQYKRAAETFSTAILIQPDNFDADSDHIQQLIEEGLLQEAIDETDQMLAQDPQQPALILQQADIFTKIGADSEALEKYQQALDICPNYLAANIKLGSCQLRSGSPDSAAKQFNRAMNINDEIVAAYLGLATAQKLSGDISEALVTLSLAGAIDANSPLLFAETAALHFDSSCVTDRVGHSVKVDIPGDVIEAHREQLGCEPQNPDVHYRLGLLLAAAGRLTEATEMFQKALEINPTFARARAKLATTLYETDEKALALEYLASPQGLDKQSLSLHYEVALLYCDQLKFASSLLNLQDKIEDSFTSADSTVNISIVLQNLGLLDRTATLATNLADLARSRQP